MSEVNKIQVGGSHYKAEGLQHWDIVDEYDVSYLAGNATKYLTRFRRKNGVQDLHKAQHYIAKMIETRSKFHSRAEGDVPDLVLQTFFADNGITGPERELIRLIFNWLNPNHLRTASVWVKALIDEYEEGAPTGAYVKQD